MDSEKEEQEVRYQATPARLQTLAGVAGGAHSSGEVDTLFLELLPESLRAGQLLSWADHQVDYPAQSTGGIPCFLVRFS
jgi:hypothetical protein